MVCLHMCHTLNNTDYLTISSVFQPSRIRSSFSLFSFDARRISSVCVCVFRVYLPCVYNCTSFAYRLQNEMGSHLPALIYDARLRLLASAQRICSNRKQNIIIQTHTHDGAERCRTSQIGAEGERERWRGNGNETMNKRTSLK